MAEFTIDDLLSTLAELRSGEKNRPANVAPTKRAINTTTKGEIEDAAPKSSVLKEWLADYLDRAKGLTKAATGPMRAAANVVALPATAAYDLGNRAVHGAFGLEPAEPMGNTGERVAGVMEGLSDTAAPFRGAGDAIREKLIAAGGRPTAPAVPAKPAAPAFSAPIPGEFGGPETPATAKPAMPRRPAMARGTQTGAFDTPTTTPGPKTQEGAFAAPQAQSPQLPPVVAKSLADEYKKRSAEIGRDADGSLTPAQKAQMELDFFLGLLAKSSQPGARMLGAFGESGLDVSKKVTEATDKNTARSERKIAQKRDDLYREMGFADKDEDNKRGDRRAATEENRWRATNENDRRRIDLLEKQINQGKWKVLDSKGGTYKLFDAETGATKDTGIKSPTSGKDDRPAEVRLLEHFRLHPEDLETALKLKGRDGTKGDITEQGSFKAAIDLLKGDVAGTMTPEQATAKVNAVIAAQRGGGATTLPAGIPPGSKQVGTAKGKPVYEAPNGKRYTVE